MAPWLVYATFSAPRLARADEPALFGRMAVWLVTGIAVILLQKSSWWTYHMLLLYPPTGMLAARGLDLAVGHLRVAVGSSTFPAMIASLLLVIPVLAALAYPAGETARRLYTSIAEHGDLETYRRTASVDYANAADAATFLERAAPPGSIYVFGDPTIHLLTGRRQAIALQGSAWDFYLPSHRQQLPTDLAVARPVWIFLESINSVAGRARPPWRCSPATTESRGTPRTVVGTPSTTPRPSRRGRGAEKRTHTAAMRELSAHLPVGSDERRGSGALPEKGSTDHLGKGRSGR